MFQEAVIQDNKQDVVSITTDDLVLWLGEKFIENKQQTRILVLQQKRIADIEALLLKSQSQSLSAESLTAEIKAQNEKLIADLKSQHEQVIKGLNTQLAASQSSIAGVEAQLLKLQSTKQEYAVSLENKVHEVALERDRLNKEIDRLNKEIEELKQKNESLLIMTSQKRKKRVGSAVTLDTEGGK